jgi:twinfilin
VDPSDLASRIPSDKPSYTFYHYPSTSLIVFIYTCPGVSKVKERMVYASSKRSVLEVARLEGVEVAKSLEASGPEEVTASMLRDEVQPKSDGATAGKQGFARPKRPGKR